MQITKGTVRVQNASATVRHIWHLITTTPVGTFQAGEVVTWAGGGSGIFVRREALTNAIFLYRTAGPSAAAGNVLTGGTSGATATVVERGATSPPGWSGVAAAGDWFVVSGSVAGVTGRVVYQIAGSITEDTFDLNAPFGETTANEAPYAIGRDRTSFFGWPLLQAGDVEALSFLGRLAQDQETSLRRAALNEQVIVAAASAAAVDWKLGHGAVITINAAPVVLSFTAPLGPARLRLRLLQDGSGSRTVTWPPATVKWPGGTAPMLTTAPGRFDAFDVDWTGAIYAASTRGLNYTP